MLGMIHVVVMTSALITQNPPGTIEGVARIAGTDRPAAHLKLHVFDQTDQTYSAVTDEKGRFRTWLMPGRTPQPDGQQEHSCWAEAESGGRWTIEAVQQGRFNQPQEALETSVISALAKPVKAVWRGGKLEIECPEPGEVDVLVRDSDGKPLSDRRVHVMPVWQMGETSRGPADARFSGKLDANGRFRMRWFPSVRDLRVSVPGEGFGATGPIDVKAGAIAKVDMALLAKFGSISGNLDAKVVAPGLFIHLEPQHHSPVACDDSGNFTFSEVPPGRYYLRVTGKGNVPSTKAAQITVWLAPGQKIEGLKIDPAPELPPAIVARQKAERERMLTQLNGKKGVVTWVEGTVKDTSGRPLEKAEVYLRTAYHGGIRMYEDILSTTTDAQGHYSFSGEIRPSTESPVLVAKVKGHPLAVVNAVARTVDNDRPAKVDLTVADVGGSASVTVLREGKPLPNVMVQLEATGSAAIMAGFGWARDSGGPAKGQFEALVEPKAVTDGNGVARFSELIPGIYNVHASDSAQGVHREARRGAFALHGVSTGAVDGVPIVAGRDTSTVVSIASANVAAAANRKIRFQVIRPHGRWTAGESVGLRFVQAGATQWHTSMKVDENGIGEHTFTADGLWSVGVQFRDLPANSFPPQEPYYEAETLLAISSAVRIAEPVRLVGVLHEAGAIRVRLLGLDGKPARGMVEIPSPFDRNGPFASTDANGEVVFKGLATGRKYQIQSYIEAQGPPPMSMGGTMPSDDAFKGTIAIVPGTQVDVSSGKETFLEMKARRVGYVRGKIQLTGDEKSEDFSIYPFQNQQALQPSWRYNSVTGEFIGGPFLSGPATLQFMRFNGDGLSRNSGRQIVEIVEGEVTHVDLKPGPIEPEKNGQRNQSVMMGMGGIAINEGVPQVEPPIVLLPDGKTPAFAAQAYLFQPGHPGPVAMGRTDGSGRLTWRGVWMSGDSQGHNKSLEVTKPTLVVSLPGRYGPMIVPIEEGKTAQIVLAESIAVEGRLAVGGRAADGGTGIRVMAAYQDRGVLNGVLSRQLSPGLDGRFRFDALTPGKYLSLIHI